MKCADEDDRSSIEREAMMRAVYLFALCCLALAAAGCLTINDADGKGSRKLIIPALTIVTNRSDEEGEYRSVTVLPLTYGQSAWTAPDGVKTERAAIALLMTGWETRTEPTGGATSEVLVAPLLLYYEKQTGGEDAEAGAAAGNANFKDDFQSALALAGFHRSAERGMISSWGYVNILLGFSRSGERRVVRLFHLIPIPFLSHGGKTPSQD
jgi:hypothetical protein